MWKDDNKDPFSNEEGEEDEDPTGGWERDYPDRKEGRSGTRNHVMEREGRRSISMAPHRSEVDELWSDTARNQ